MSYIGDYERFVDSLDRGRSKVRAQRKERQALRANLLALAICCAVLLCLALLAVTGPGDALAGGAA